MSLDAAPARIALIAESIYRYDAMSATLVDAWRFLRENPKWTVSLLVPYNERPEIPARLVTDLSDLLLAPEYLAADLLIHNFGSWNPYVDALLLGNGRARQAAFFHNITPAEFMPARDRQMIEKSFRQLNNLRLADRVWPVSRSDSELLMQQGFDPRAIEIVPLAIDRPALRSLADKPPLPVQVVFIGRVVQHKGVLDLVRAVERICGRDIPQFRVQVVGSFDWDPCYAERCREAIRAAGLADRIAVLGTVDDATRDRLLHAAHILAIPSYHEGFGKPVIEGLRAGCIPVGYASYNLRYTAEGLCRMVPPGDIVALSEALAEAISDAGAAVGDSRAVLRLDRGELTEEQFSAAARAHVEQFDPRRVAALVRQSAARLIARQSARVA